jgi:predicted RNase H-like HicB family nuclease
VRYSSLKFKEVVRVKSRYAVVLEQGESGWIVASAPALPGCHSQGRTREEALANIQEAMRGYLAVLEQDGEDLPKADLDAVMIEVAA